MSARLRLVIVSVALLIGVALVTPTEAQSRFWVLVNGALRYNGPIAVGNGTAALPSMSFASDPSKGFFSPGAGSIGVSLSAGEWSRFTAGQIAIFGNTAALALGNASDVVFTRAAAGEFTLSTVLFASLGTPASGTFCYCSDCTIANPCASGGSGAFAKRLNGAWVCN